MKPYFNLTMPKTIVLCPELTIQLNSMLSLVPIILMVIKHCTWRCPFNLPTYTARSPISTIKKELLHNLAQHKTIRIKCFFQIIIIFKSPCYNAGLLFYLLGLFVKLFLSLGLCTKNSRYFTN